MRQISGNQIAEEIIERIKTSGSPKKILAAIMVGENSASESFLKQKAKAAEKAGIIFYIFRFPENIKTEELQEEIKHFSEDENIGGIIIQLPLPKFLDTAVILNSVPKEKDPDVLSVKAFLDFESGDGLVLPPAVGVIKEIIEREYIELKNINVAIIGLGNLVGKPISVWLKNKVKELSIIRRNDSFEPLKKADLVILGTGSPNLIKAETLKEGAGVIDFGYGLVNINGQNKISGDLDSESKLENLSFYTPTPKGTGPILVAKLMENFAKLCEKY